MTRVGIAGLGTVGAATVHLIQNWNQDTAEIILSCVSARDKSKDRGLNLGAVKWCDTPNDLIAHCDVIVEVIGGTSAMVHDLNTQTLAQGKKLITANKAWLAANPEAITHPNIYFEAAVGGGIPMIRTVQDYMRGNRITAIKGILNGTCNFILSEMADKGANFDTVLKQAQDLGYAEADPAADIDGHDSAQKLIILSKLAFDRTLTEAELPTQGIRGIADATGIKLIASATRDGTAQVAPTHAKGTGLESVNGVDNAIVIDAEPLGRLVLQGPGAGGGATASAVMADIIDACTDHCLG